MLIKLIVIERNFEQHGFMLNSILTFLFVVSVPQISQKHNQKEIKAHEQARRGGH